MTIASKYQNIDFRASFASWAYKVLENKMRDYFKTQHRHDSKFERVSEPIPTRVSQDLDPITRRQMLECLRKVGQANGRFARILNLHYQGYSTDEICRKLNLTQSYFYVVLSRARSMLAICIEKGDIADNE
jgi:RNA polymerase sigma factor (sigma-70 family)